MPSITICDKPSNEDTDSDTYRNLESSEIINRKPSRHLKFLNSYFFNIYNLKQIIFELTEWKRWYVSNMSKQLDLANQI